MNRTILFALFVRILIALSTRTFFQPDEYFQSLEPAHHIVFGYGHLTWEWLSSAPVRSVLYPALNVPVYSILKLLNLEDGWLLIAGPKIVHGAFAALTDVWVCDLTRRVLGERYVSTAFFLSLTSFFHALSLSRSLSNSLETSLTTIAITFYPWDIQASPRSSIRIMLIFAALACAVRPTNAVIWIYLIGILVWRERSRKSNLASIALHTLVTGTISLLVLFTVDTLYYGTITLTPLNFLRTNLSPVSLFYGRSPAHYYLTQAVPILCTTALPFVLHGAWLALQNAGDRRTRSRVLRVLGCVVWTVGVYSLAGHKEWRFLHPLLPFMHILAAKSLVDVYGRDFKRQEKPTTTRWNSITLPPIRTDVLIFLLLTLPASLYIILFHSSVQISVMHYLRALPSSELKSIGFLMPCHSTPGHAYLHRQELAEPGRMWALGCEPPLGLSIDDLSSYQDQTDIFYASPSAYLARHFPPAVDLSFPPSIMPCSPPGVTGRVDWQHEWPQYLVMFGTLLEHGTEVRTVLEEKGYGEVWKVGWDWEGDGKRKGGVRVWKYLA